MRPDLTPMHPAQTAADLANARLQRLVQRLRDEAMGRVFVTSDRLLDILQEERL